MHAENEANGKYTTLAVMEGELTSITVKGADSGHDLLVFVPPGAMTARAVAALRLGHPTSQIVEKSARSGVVIHSVQTIQDFAALQTAIGWTEGGSAQTMATQGQGRGQMTGSETRVNERLNFTDALGALLRCSRMYGVRLVCVAPEGEAMLERLGLRLIEADVIGEADKTRFVHEIGALTLDCSKGPLEQFGRDVSEATAMVRDPT